MNYYLPHHDDFRLSLNTNNLKSPIKGIDVLKTQNKAYRP